MSELRDGFSGPDYELVVGRIRGLRRWYVKPGGQLVGAYDHRWTDGEQTLKCIFASLTMPQRWTDAMDRHDYADALKTVTEHQADPLKMDDTSKCTCGFYAYHSVDAAFGAGIMTLGMMEGWGRVTVGELGFRSEKARVIALVRPWGSSMGGMSSLIPRILFVGAIIINVWAIIHSLVTGSAFPWFSVIAIALNIFMLKMTNMIDSAIGSDDVTDAEIRKMYPDVRIFKTKRGMLKAFPMEEVS